jgi:hypothetical protein
MKYTIEIIVGDNLIERVIECDYLNTTADRYNFMLSKDSWECDCGTKHSFDESVGNYPKNIVIIKELEL